MPRTTQQRQLVRRPAYAGIAYPSDPIELTERIDDLLNVGKPTAPGGRLIALSLPCDDGLFVSPASKAAAELLEPSQWRSIAIVAQAQQSFFDYASIFAGGAYETPLGRVFVDVEEVERLSELHPRVILSTSGHVGGKAAEFGIELPLVLLQRKLGDFRLIPIIMGCAEDETIAGMGEIMTELLRTDATLLVIASEMTLLTSPPPGGAAEVKKLLATLGSGEWRALRDRLASAAEAAPGPLLALAYAMPRVRHSAVTIIAPDVETGVGNQRAQSVHIAVFR